MIAQNLADTGSGGTAPSPVPQLSPTQPLPAALPGSPPLPGSTPPAGTSTAQPSAPATPTVGGLPPMTPTAAASTGTTPTVSPVPNTTSMPGVSLTPTDASNDLRGQTISVAPTANRLQTAESALQNFNQATDPAYQASLREATANAAGAGQLGSGQLRTSYGNLADQRNLQLETQGNSLLEDAINGSIQDQYNNVAIAQQQQQAQEAAQNQTFGQGITAANTQQSLSTSAIDNALNELAAGDSGNPSTTSLLLSQIFGGQAAQGNSALSGLIGGTINSNAQNAQTSQLQQVLQSLGIGAAGVPTTTAPITQTTAPDSVLSNGIFG